MCYSYVKGIALRGIGIPLDKKLTKQRTSYSISGVYFTYQICPKRFMIEFFKKKNEVILQKCNAFSRPSKNELHHTKH